MRTEAMIVRCHGCDAVFDMDYQPGMCSCDGDVDDRQDLHLVRVSAGEDGWTARAEHVELTATSGDAETAIISWIDAFDLCVRMGVV